MVTMGMRLGEWTERTGPAHRWFQASRASLDTHAEFGKTFTQRFASDIIFITPRQRMSVETRCKGALAHPAEC